MRLLSAFAIGIALCASSAFATDYYVDLGAGNDAGAGTLGDPWRTLTYAMSTVAPNQGHRVLVRGHASASSPGESFPIGIRSGISLGTWSAQEGATIDAGTAPCLQLVMPGTTSQSIAGEARNLVITGTPAIGVTVVALTDSADLVVEDCLLTGGVAMTLAATPTSRQLLSRIALRDCELFGDVVLRRQSSLASFSHDIFVASLLDNVVHGDVTIAGIHASNYDVDLRGNRLDGDLSLDGALARLFTVSGNALTAGSIDVGGFGSASGSGFQIRDNVVAVGLNLNCSMGTIVAAGNRTGTGLSIRGVQIAEVKENVVGGGLQCQSFLGQNVPTLVQLNRAHGMWISIESTQPLTVADNELSSTLTFDYMPNAAIEIRANRFACGAGEDAITLGLRSPGSFPIAPQISIRENRFTQTGTGGRALHAMQRYASFEFVDNRIEGFATGLSIHSRAVMGGTPSGTGFRIERNHFRSNAVGLNLDLSSSQENLLLIGNVVEGGTRGLVLNRGTYGGTIRMRNNVLAFHSAQDVAGTFAPIDLVQWNLAADGSLLARALTNISGDPHFVDRTAGDVGLLPSSPAVGSGVDAQTLVPGFNMGLDPLQPPSTLSFRTTSPSNGSLRLSAPAATSALFLFALAPAAPASIPICDGRFGLDPTTWVATLPAALQNGSATLEFALPSGPWSVAVQALFDATGTPPCRASNTAIVRR